MKIVLDSKDVAEAVLQFLSRRGDLEGKKVASIDMIMHRGISKTYLEVAVTVRASPKAEDCGGSPAGDDAAEETEPGDVIDAALKDFPLPTEAPAIVSGRGPEAGLRPNGDDSLATLNMLLGSATLSTVDLIEWSRLSERALTERRSTTAEVLGLLDRCCRILEEQALEPFEWRETYRMVREFRSSFDLHTHGRNGERLHHQGVEAMNRKELIALLDRLQEETRKRTLAEVEGSERNAAPHKATIATIRDVILIEAWNRGIRDEP